MSDNEMTIEQARRIVAAGHPEPCRNGWHAHGTWGFAETFDRTCPDYFASGQYHRAVAVLKKGKAS